MGSKQIKWQTWDHIKEEKSPDWFWIVGIIAVGLIVLCIFFGNILLALLIALATFTSFMLAHSVPRVIEYEISRRGVRAGDIVYPFSSIESFWVVDEDGFDRDRVLLKSKKMLMPMITIPIGDGAEIEKVRECLLDYLKEEEMYESVFEIIMRKLGF